MYDHSEKSKVATSASQERRGVGRHPFIAAAEVVEIGSQAVFSTRTTDLGPGGCFVDTLAPFEAGTRVRVSIREGATLFEAAGMVVYSQSGLGMGIAFDPLTPGQQEILTVWLGEEVVHEGQGQAYEGIRRASKPMLPHGSDREALVRLVRLMVEKGLLSESDGSAIFGNPVLF